MRRVGTETPLLKHQDEMIRDDGDMITSQMSSLRFNQRKETIIVVFVSEVRSIIFS